MVRGVFDAVFDYDLAARRPPRMLAPSPDAHSDAERIADLLRIRRRSAPLLLGFITVWALGTGAAAVSSGWGAPWWAWLTVGLAAILGAVVGTIAATRSMPSVDDAIARLRAQRFRPLPNTTRPGVAGMVVGLFLCAVMVMPTTEMFHGAVQADLWAFDGGIVAAGGLTLYLLGRRTWSALAALPEASPAAE